MGRGHFRNTLSPSKKNTAAEILVAGAKNDASAIPQDFSSGLVGKMDMDLGSKPQSIDNKPDVSKTALGDLEKNQAAPEVSEESLCATSESDGAASCADEVGAAAPEVSEESLCATSESDGAASCADEVGAAAPKDGTSSGNEDVSTDAEAKEKRETASVVFDDVTVCRYLKIRRRVLDGARTASARGVDWDCVDAHAGRTKAWIDKYALDKHIMPNFAIKLEPIKAGDGIASVRLIGTHPNLEMCAVEKLSDGSRCFAHVRNLLKFPIHFREGFDCRVIGHRLEWVYNLNEVAY